jgi:hypothetical protein
MTQPRVGVDQGLLLPASKNSILLSAIALAHPLAVPSCVMAYF